MKNKVTIEFDTEEQAKEFVSFFSGHGEQVYWEWASCQDNQEDFVKRFNYEAKSTSFKGTNEESV